MVRKNKSIIYDSLFMIHSRGFTLVELAVVTSIIVSLLGFITIGLVRSQQTASLTSAEEVLLSDLKQQQLRAMVGDTDGQTEANSYGIHFDSNRYVLFRGAYSDLESSNFVVNLPDTINFNAESRPEIIFEKVKGEVYQFSDGPNKIILQDATNGNTKTITINQYGVIVEVN